ncbi:MAG TPA: HAD family phosphatase [Chloroflexota bacterium]|nr:HAD family phosphatase [Chloroflexota bacterium]
MSEPVRVCAFDAVIFDLDGVLLDSEPIYLAATNTVLAREGKYLSSEENARYIGVRFRDMLGDVIPRMALAHDADYYIDQTRDEVLRAFGGPLQPPPGARELIERLADHGVPRAVGSSSVHAWVDQILTNLGVRHHFPIVVGGDEVPHGKPAPDIFLRCAELLAVPPERCAVIEDSPNGVLAARRAGMTAIGLRTAATSTLVLEGCLAVVDSFHEAAGHLGVTLDP